MVVNFMIMMFKFEVEVEVVNDIDLKYCRDEGVYIVLHHTPDSSSCIPI